MKNLPLPLEIVGESLRIEMALQSYMQCIIHARDGVEREIWRREFEKTRLEQMALIDQAWQVVDGPNKTMDKIVSTLTINFSQNCIQWEEKEKEESEIRNEIKIHNRQSGRLGFIRKALFSLIRRSRD